MIVTARTRLLFVGGKGGVGKTTVAATIALQAAHAEPRREVLLMSTDPAHSLGDAFDAALDDEARTITGAPRNLKVRELDAAIAYAKKRDRYRNAVDELFTALAGNRHLDVAFDRDVLRDLFDLAPPGLDEVFAVVEVIEELPRRGLIIIDTAPTGHTLRLLEIPAMAREWVRVFMRIVLKYREVIGLGELATELLDLARQLRELDALLRDPERCGFVAVTRAAALPRLETVRLLEALERLEIPERGIVVNAITPKGCERCARARLKEAREVRMLERATETAIILTPARAIPPRGVKALESFGATWLSRT